MEKRSLVGRRYEDYLRNDIHIELTTDELLWRMVLNDPRYNALVERREGPRRKDDDGQQSPMTALNPEGAFLFIQELED